MPTERVFPELLNMSQLAAFLGVSRPKMYEMQEQLIAKGYIKPVTVGKLVMYRKSTVLKALDKCEKEGTPFFEDD